MTTSSRLDRTHTHFHSYSPIALCCIALPVLLLAACGQSDPQAAPVPTTTTARATTVPATVAAPTAVPPTVAPPPVPTGVPPTVPAPTAIPPTAAAPAAPPASRVVQIAVVDNRFEPPNVEVPAGTLVRWTNSGTDDHDVVSEDLKTIESPLLKPGMVFETTFTQPGSIAYFCSLHVGMDATLVVK